MEMTVHELKEHDYKRYLEEYWKWTSYIPDDWWYPVWDTFVDETKILGLHRLNKPTFNLAHTQAAFAGRASLAPIMERLGLHEKCYPLYLAVVEDGSYASLSTTHRGNIDFELQESTLYTNPLGVFADMPLDDWVEMLKEMWVQHDPYEAAKPFIRDLCSDLARQLEEAYEWETSEEQFMDSCDANEVTFEVDDDEI